MDVPAARRKVDAAADIYEVRALQGGAAEDLLARDALEARKQHVVVAGEREEDAFAQAVRGHKRDSRLDRIGGVREANRPPVDADLTVADPARPKERLDQLSAT